MFEKIFAPGHVAKLPYFARYAPKIDRQWMLVLHIVIGAFVSSKGNFKIWVVAFIGGISLLDCTRMAGRYRLEMDRSCSGI